MSAAHSSRILGAEMRTEMRARVSRAIVGLAAGDGATP
jgi:hypothetical protein